MSLVTPFDVENGLFRITGSLWWLRMPWLPVSPGHQLTLQDKQVLVIHEEGFPLSATSHCLEMIKNASSKNSARVNMGVVSSLYPGHLVTQFTEICEHLISYKIGECLGINVFEMLALLHKSGIILDMGSANERRRYYVTPSLIG